MTKGLFLKAPLHPHLSWTISVAATDSLDDKGVVPEGPAVGWMGLLDVDDEEVGQVCVLLHQTVEVTQLGHERGSGAAPEVQHLKSK